MTIFLKAPVNHLHTSLEPPTMCPFLLDSKFHHTLHYSIHRYVNLLVPTYTLEYQDHNSEIWEHNILSYGVSMVNPYNLLHPTQPVTIGSCPYPHWYHNSHYGSYRINLKQHHYSTILQPPKMGQTTVEISWCAKNISHKHPYQPPPNRRRNRLIFFIIH